MPGPGSCRGSESIPEAVARWDDAVYTRLAHTGGNRFDVVSAALSRAADYSVLWIAAAAAMRLLGGRRTGRAAARGLGTIAVSSLVTNQGLKRLNRRVRPDSTLVPLRRKARRMPTSSSFPSGHAASAAAFCTAVAVENRRLGIALGALAGAVGLSRVTTGAHHPSDVLAGFAVGAGIAAAGARLFPPVLPVVEPGHQPDQESVDPLPGGAGLTVVVNESSGVDKPSVLGDIRDGLPHAKVVTLGDGEDLQRVAEQAVADGARALGACGGDGTIVALAQVALAHGLPLAVFPGGTFNHFAKDARVPQVADTVEGIEKGVGTWVDVATLNDEIFLNTASVGAYPEFVTEREKLEPRYGKRLAALIAAYRLLHAKPQTKLRVDGRPVTAMLFFVGNSRYEPADFAPVLRPRLDDGKLDLRILVSDKRALTPRLLWAFLTGTVEQSRLYERKLATELDVEILSDEVLISRDGEVDPPVERIRFGVRERALFVYQPENPPI